MRKISELLYQRATYPIAIFLTLAMILYAALVMGSQSACISDHLAEGQSLLGLKFGYDTGYVLELFQNMDVAALKCYRLLLGLWDNIFPLLYGAMYLTWLSVIYKNIRIPHMRWINLYPILPMIMDWVENYHEKGLIRQFLDTGTVLEYTVGMASLLTQIKWTTSYLNYLVILTGIVILIVRRKRNKRA